MLIRVADRAWLREPRGDRRFRGLGAVKEHTRALAGGSRSSYIDGKRSREITRERSCQTTSYGSEELGGVGSG